MIKRVNGFDIILKSKKGTVVGLLQGKEFIRIENRPKGAKYYFLKLNDGGYVSLWVNKTRLRSNREIEIFLED